METKQGRWRRPERGRARAWVGGGEEGLAGCRLGNGNRGAPRFIRVAACQAVPPVFAAWPPFLVYFCSRCSFLHCDLADDQVHTVPFGRFQVFPGGRENGGTGARQGTPALIKGSCRV